MKDIIFRFKLAEYIEQISIFLERMFLFLERFRDYSGNSWDINLQQNNYNSTNFPGTGVERMYHDQIMKI